MRELERTACHEVGHALVGWTLGGRIDSVQIYDPPRHRDGRLISGHTRMTMRARDDADRVWLSGVVLVAGAAAELVFAGNFSGWHASTDIERARTLLATYGHDLAGLASDTAIELIAERRALAARLADALLIERMLDQTAFMRLLRRYEG
jgi:ATP-dependent Zn protease